MYDAVVRYRPVGLPPDEAMLGHIAVAVAVGVIRPAYPDVARADETPALVLVVLRAAVVMAREIQERLTLDDPVAGDGMRGEEGWLLAAAPTQRHPLKTADEAHKSQPRRTLLVKAGQRTEFRIATSDGIFGGEEGAVTLMTDTGYGTLAEHSEPPTLSAMPGDVAASPRPHCANYSMGTGESAL